MLTAQSVQEPTFRANRIKVVDAVNDATRLAPGYIFFAPFARDGQPLVGPQIIDSAGVSELQFIEVPH